MFSEFGFLRSTAEEGKGEEEGVVLLDEEKNQLQIYPPLITTV